MPNMLPEYQSNEPPAPPRCLAAVPMPAPTLPALAIAATFPPLLLRRKPPEPAL